MTRITWDAPGDVAYGIGVDRGVFYPKDGIGVPWNGLASVKETTDSTTQTVMYIDGQKRVNQLGLGSFAASIDAYTYPDEFLPYDGYAEPIYSGQARPLFNFVYRTQDQTGSETSYKLHLVYNCVVKPTSKDHQSVSASVNIETFTWELTTTPIAVPNSRASAHFVFDTRAVLPSILQAVEAILYGTDSTDPRFPSLDELIAIFESNSLYVIIDNGDGSWTAIGPDDAISVDGDEITLNWPWVDVIDDDTYRIKTY